jgi:hypothetical protein
MMSIAEASGSQPQKLSGIQVFAVSKSTGSYVMINRKIGVIVESRRLEDRIRKLLEKAIAESDRKYPPQARDETVVRGFVECRAVQGKELELRWTPLTKWSALL